MEGSRKLILKGDLLNGFIIYFFLTGRVFRLTHTDLISTDFHLLVNYRAVMDLWNKNCVTLVQEPQQRSTTILRISILVELVGGKFSSPKLPFAVSVYYTAFRAALLKSMQSILLIMG